MLGLGGGLNPKKMQAMMKQLGMSQEEIESAKVTIEKLDGTKLVFQNPNVTKISMQGQDTFQIVGDLIEEAEKFSPEDIQTIIEKTGKTEEEAIKALEETGDLAEAIMKLSE